MVWRASIEVLTDGSELTEPALFLTIRRYNNSTTTKQHITNANKGNDQTNKEVDTNFIYYEHHNSSEQFTDNDIDEGTTVARYNLTGIPSLTGRISADQSYKLLQGGAFKAILIPSLISLSSFDNDTDDNNNDLIYNNNTRGASLSGLPSLFLSLIQSGYKVAQPSTTSKQNTNNVDSDSAPEIDDNTSQSSTSGYGDISIVGPRGTGSTVDGILDTMFGNVRRPAIRICEVPTENGVWYEVYVDSYIKIWGQSIRHCASNGLSSKSMNGSFNKREEFNEEESSAESFPPSSDEDSSDEESEEEEAGGDNNNLSSSTEAYSIVYIVMLLPQKTKIESAGEEGGSYSFAITPRDPSQRQNALQTLRNLPQEVVSSRKDSLLLDFILHLDPPVYKGNVNQASNVHKGPLSKRQRTECTTVDKSLKRVPQHEIEVPSWVNRITKHHLITSPNHTSIDEGILIRAQQRSKLLNDSLPFAFPISVNNSSVVQDYNQNIKSSFGLRSCTSVILNGWNKSDTEKPFSFLSRVESVNKRCCKVSLISNEEAKEHMTAIVDYKSMLQSIKCSFYGDKCFCGKCEVATVSCNTDENEIDLVNSSDSDESQTSNKEDIRMPPHDAIDVSSPHMLILGTGCATPSPLRGSSAYGILLPTVLDGGVSSLVLGAVLECGEGTLTSLLRHLPSLHGTSNRDTSMMTSLEVHLSHVSFIWISHAHLDHYGDLPIVVQAIINAKQKCNHNINHQETNKLLVIAPSKVLKYLNVMLNNTTTARSSIRSSYKQLYAGVTHRELQYSPFARHLISLVTEYKLPRQSGQKQQEQKPQYHPFHALQNVEVEHCREAFGLVLTLNIPTKHTIQSTDTSDTSRFILCFSGDTRPSIQFAKKCQSYSSPYPINLLLHEGTFLHDNQGQAEAAQKRHSTTTEALDIANHMNAQCCILTHFSQRYIHMSVQDVVKDIDSGSYPFCWGIAIDGMMIPLKKQHALLNVNTLSKCVDNVILQSDT